VPEKETPSKFVEKSAKEVYFSDFFVPREMNSVVGCSVGGRGRGRQPARPACSAKSLACLKFASLNEKRAARRVLLKPAR